MTTRRPGSRPAPPSAAADAPRRTPRPAVLLTGSALLTGAVNYGGSVLAMRLLTPPEYARYAAVAAVLLVVGALAGATMPPLVARVTARQATAGQVSSVTGPCLRIAVAAALVCAVAAGAVTLPYATPGLLTVIAVAVAALWVNATGLGLTQSRQAFRSLAVLWTAEAVLRAAVTAVAAATGGGDTGAIAGFAAAAGSTALAALAVRPRRTSGPDTAAVPKHRTDDRARGPEGAGATAASTTGPMWRQALAIGLLQALVYLLPALDVVVAAAVQEGDAALAPYQALLLPARVPVFVATALAAVLLPRLTRCPAWGPTHGALGQALRQHAATVSVLVAATATCPPEILALAVPPAYAASADLLVPLGIAAGGHATLVLLVTVFLAWGPLLPVAVTLALVCPFAALGYGVAASGTRALAWTSAAVAVATAGAVAVLAWRRAGRVRPGRGAGCSLLAVPVPALVLGALRPHPLPWCLAAVALAGAATGWVTRRQRRAGPLRVLHLAFEDPRAPGAGGGSVRTHQVNRRLAASGVRVTAVCAPWPGCTPTTRDGVRYVPVLRRLAPVLRHRFPCQLAYFAAVTVGLPLLVRRTDPDLVVEDFAAPFSSVCVPWWTRRPVVGVVQWLAAREKARDYRLPFGAVERLGLRSHTTLVTVSEGLAEEVRRRRPQAHVVALPNGLDAGAVAARPPRDGNHLLYLGRLEHTSKGLDVLLRAYARVAGEVDTDLWIAGDGPHARALRELADRLGTGRRVRWLGRVDGDARFALLASARLVCVPSRYETFGLVAAEALACGTPVLCFDIPCLRDLVTRETGVRVPPGDTTAYGDALAALARDPERCRRLGAAGPASVRHLDWRETAHRQLALYRTVARHTRTV
ncbi:glycosyltransferase [Streptomyces flavalbus]|uniref:D-inositol 3-phosphate glycosyltransferase n=1 Tax=Streptomyces flavalbus TaxID=2665155 RepID=A0ABW2WEJ0_9ACTN